MKRIFISMLILFSLSFSAALTAGAQLYVEIRPSYVAPVRPAQPDPSYIWVDEDWRADGSTYRYIGGHWESPKPGYYHKKGYWKKSTRGYIWVPRGWVKQQYRGKGKWNGKWKAKNKGN